MLGIHLFRAGDARRAVTLCVAAAVLCQAPATAAAQSSPPRAHSKAHPQAAAQSAGAKQTAAKQTAVAAQQRRDVRLQVAFTTRALASDQQTPVRTALESFARDTINGGTGYVNSFTACVVGSTALPCPSDLGKIDVLVTTTVGALGTSKQQPVTMAAVSLIDNRQIGQLVVTSGDVAKGKLSDVLSALSTEQLRELLGTPILADGALTLAAFSPYVQLVPETATDRKYIDILAHYLAQRRIETVPSAFTGLDASGTGTPVATTICQNNPRYLHYTVSTRQQQRPLQFRTITYAQATGQIIDCGDPAAPIAFNSFTPTSVTNTKGPIGSIVTILTQAFVSKSNSWANVGAVGNSLGSFIDVDPTSASVEQSVYNASLRTLVDDMCLALARYATARRQAEAPGQSESRLNRQDLLTTQNLIAPEMKRVSTTGGSTASVGGSSAGQAATGAAASSAGTQNPLGGGGISVASQPPLECAPLPPAASNQ